MQSVSTVSPMSSLHHITDRLSTFQMRRYQNIDSIDTTIYKSLL